MNFMRHLLTRRVAAIALIVVGLVVVVVYGIRSVRSYQQLQYIQEQGLDDGSADVDAIRGWMTIRYIGVAYAVPEEYIYAELDIPFERRKRDEPLGRLNREYNLGLSAKGDYPVLVDQVQAAIIAYRENPVATGLDDIRGWMSILYIANSTGIPEDYLLKQLDVSSDDNNLYKPLERLARDVDYEGGGRALTEAIKTTLVQYEVEQ